MAPIPIFPSHLLTISPMDSYSNMLKLVQLPYLAVVRKLFTSLDLRNSAWPTRVWTRAQKPARPSPPPPNPPPIQPVEPVEPVEHAKPMQFTQTSETDIKPVILDLFKRFNLSYDVVPYDWALHNLCLAEAQKMGYISSLASSSDLAVKSFQKYLPSGVCLAATSYAHLGHNRKLQTWIALYIAVLTYIDDEYLRDVKEVEAFGKSLILGQDQPGPVFETMAKLLKGVYEHYQGTVADIVTTSTLNNITAIVLEYRMQGMKIHPESTKLSTFLRVMTSLCEALAMFAFPADLPIEEYIEALPEIVVFINGINDVLSFYKEELAQESINFVTTQAHSLGRSKLEAFQDLADDVVTCHQRVLHILEKKDPRAKESYLKFAHGCFYFHTSLDMRYHLSELFTPSS